MPILYFARRYEQPVKRAILTFRELRGMFGGYETRFISYGWARVIRSACCTLGCVVAEVRSGDGSSEQYPHIGLYHLVGLSTAKVDELLRFRETYGQRTQQAERWELGKRPAITHSTYAARRRSQRRRMP